MLGVRLVLIQLDLRAAFALVGCDDTELATRGEEGRGPRREQHSPVQHYVSSCVRCENAKGNIWLNTFYLFFFFNSLRELFAFPWPVWKDK